MAWRFGAEDAQPEGLLSGLLHDAPCAWSADSFDPELQRLVITAYRPRHEAPRRRRVLGVISVTRLQVVPAKLVVHNVRHATLKPVTSTSTCSFDYMELQGSTLRIFCEGGTVEAELTGWTSIELRDVGPPSDRPAINTISLVTTSHEWEDELQRRWFDA